MVMYMVVYISAYVSDIAATLIHIDYRLALLYIHRHRGLRKRIGWCLISEPEVTLRIASRFGAKSKPQKAS